MRRINFSILLISFLIISFLTGISFLAAMGGEGFLFIFFCFPTHTLFWDYFTSSSHLYRVGLYINIAFYAVLTERLITHIKGVKLKNHK